MSSEEPERLLIFGNAAAGKTTLARQLAATFDLAHLDLDVLAWQPSAPPRRQSLQACGRTLDKFLAKHPRWVIEGCYADLLALVTDRATEMIFLDLPVDICVANARNRPWEPHKYASQEAQDANLVMLLEWIRDYDRRDDSLSRAAHEALYRDFSGPKRRVAANCS